MTTARSSKVPARRTRTRARGVASSAMLSPASGPASGPASAAAGPAAGGRPAPGRAAGRRAARLPRGAARRSRPPGASALEDKPLPPDTLLATINGQKITQSDVTMAAEDLGANLPQPLKGKAREAYLLDYLIDGTLVAQKAKSDKLDQTPDFGRKLVYANDKILMEALLTVIAKGATSDATLHKIYDEAAAQQKPEEEIHARHVLVATEADAQAVLKRLRAGEDFTKVAKEVSKDPGSEGGDLGWFTKERMVPAFAEAAFNLQQGQFSEPVKTQFGWHVIQVEGKRQKTFPPFDQVKEQIVRYSVQKAQSDLILDLRKTAKIERTARRPRRPGDPGGAGGGRGQVGGPAATHLAATPRVPCPASSPASNSRTPSPPSSRRWRAACSAPAGSTRKTTTSPCASSATSTR